MERRIEFGFGKGLSFDDKLVSLLSLDNYLDAVGNWAALEDEEVPETISLEEAMASVKKYLDPTKHLEFEEKLKKHPSNQEIPYLEVFKLMLGEYRHWVKP